MPVKRPVKPSSRKKKAAGPAPEKEARGAGSRPSKPKRSAAKGKPAVVRPRVSEDLYSSLFRKNHAVMLIIDPADGRIVDANQAAIRFYGYTARKLKTLRISDINMLDAGEVGLNMDQAVRKIRRYFIFRHRLADGTIRDVEVYSGPVIVKGRKLLYSIVHDITERKRAGEALRFEREQLLSLFDSMDTLVYVTDPSTNEILYMNKTMDTLFGPMIFTTLTTVVGFASLMSASIPPVSAASRCWAPCRRSPGRIPRSGRWTGCSSPPPAGRPRPPAPPLPRP
mgnify:CR=1 FL=1